MMGSRVEVDTGVGAREGKEGTTEDSAALAVGVEGEVVSSGGW